MTLPQILITYGAVSAVTGCIVGHILRLLDTPSPCERDAQDGRGEVGEGAKHQIHNGGINS